MPEEKGIEQEARDLVYGARAASYGHPRADFAIIARVWSGLLQDVLKDGAELDAHRVAVLMTGLKLARLVNSPLYRDSRVDVVGYMLTMERLDEAAEESPCGHKSACDCAEPRCPAHGKSRCPACSQNPVPENCQCGYFASTGMHWDTCPGRVRSFPAPEPAYDQALPWQPPGRVMQCMGVCWVRDPAGRAWLKESGDRWVRLTESAAAPYAEHESRCHK